VVVNLYKSKSFTDSSISQYKTWQTVPTLTTTKKIHKRTQPTNQMVSNLSDPNSASSQGRYPGQEGVNPSSALP